jgi:uncharacterized cupin superfamily protein
VIAHWDEIEPVRLDVGPMGLVRTDLGRAAQTVDLGVARLQIDPGGRASAVHVHYDQEEIFYVLDGSGLSWQDGKTYEVGAGDCIVHLAGKETHTLIAGPDGISVLAYGERLSPTLTRLPHSGIYVGAGVMLDASLSGHVWEREPEELEVPEPSPRPPNIVNADVVEGRFGGLMKPLGRTAGAVRTGLNLVSLPPGDKGAPAHCHSAEEEIFVFLDGDATLRLTPSPQRAAAEQEQEIAIRAGHVVSRPAGTGIAHSFRAGEQGCTFLAYGGRNSSDVIYYPDSNKIFFKGVGLIGRLENLDYMDGEEG